MRLDEALNETAVVAFGRMNPITIGHQKLVRKIEEEAELSNGISMLFLSHSQDHDKNPLSYEDKIRFAKKVFGDIVVESSANNVFQVLTELSNQGYRNVIYICGSDRMEEMKKWINTNHYVDKKGNLIYDFDSIKLVSSGDRDADSTDEVEGASASKARQFVKDGNFNRFLEIVPFNETDAKELYNLIAESLGVSLIESRKSSGSDIKSLLRTNINSNRLYKIESNRHKDEVLRVRVAGTVDNTEKSQELLKRVIELINDTNNYIDESTNLFADRDQKPHITIEDEPRNYSNEADTSKEYHSLKIKFDDRYYYICLNTGEKKSLTPNKVLKSMGKQMPYNNIALKDDIPQETFDLLQAVLKVAAEDGAVSPIQDDNTFTLTIPDWLYGKINDSGNRSLIIDFSEVFGAVAYANALHKKSNQQATVMFPSNSNEKLVDYYITVGDTPKEKMTYSISAKVDEGGHPSSVVFLENVCKSNATGSDAYKAAKHIYELIAPVSVQDGFMSLAESLEAGNHIAGVLYKDVPRELIDYEIADVDSVRKFIDLCGTYAHRKFKGPQTNTLIECLNSGGDLYKKSIKIKYLSSIVIAFINDTPNLIETMNALFRQNFGKLIQLHMKDNKNVYTFTIQTTDTANFNFINNTGINTKKFILDNQKLAMKLVTEK